MNATPPTKPLVEQIKSVARELALRRNVYPLWIKSGRMKEKDATHELACMESILQTLKGLEEKELIPNA